MAASMDPAEGRPVPAVETNGIKIISAPKEALGLPKLAAPSPSTRSSAHSLLVTEPRILDCINGSYVGLFAE